MGVKGFGRSGDASPDQLELLEKHVKVEIVCRDGLVEEVVLLIQKRWRIQDFEATERSM